MRLKILYSLEPHDQTQISCLRDIVGLLKNQLTPAERDKNNRHYRLAWYGRMQANEFSSEDIEACADFVGDMIARCKTRAETGSSHLLTADLIETDRCGLKFIAHRARQMADHFLASLREDILSRPPPYRGSLSD